MDIKDFAEFKNSPIVHRHMDIAIDLDDSCFDQKIPAWLAGLVEAGDYTDQDIRQFWLFRIEKSEAGVPKPKARLYQIPRLLHKVKGEVAKGIEIVPSIENGPQVLRFMQWRPGKEVTRFADLRSEVERWLPGFCKEFEIEQLGGFTLRYVNDIGIKKHPDLWHGGSLVFQEVLSFIPAPQAQFGDYIHPFKAETVQAIGPDKKILFKSAFETTEKSFEVIFEYNSLGDQRDRKIDEVFTEMERAHQLILQQFAAQFSESALKYFKG